MSQYAAPHGPVTPPPARGRTVVLAAVAVVVLLGAGFAAGFFVGRPASGPTALVNAKQACAALDRWQLPADPEEVGIDTLHEGHAAYGLAQAAARDDSAYDELADLLTDVLTSVTTLNVDDLYDQADAARAECSELGL